LSPILVRPVREQLEHDRVIGLLQANYKRKSEVAMNPGNQQTMPVGTGTSAWFPDLVLYASDKNRKVIGVVEVETAESVNNLEAMSQWAAFSRLRIPFHLYIPASYVDVARRLCQEHQISPPEIWTYQAIGDQIRFAMVQRGIHGEPKGRPAVAPKPAPAAAAKPAAPAAAAKPAAPAAAAKPAAPAAPAKAVAPATKPAMPALKAAAPAAAPAAAKPKAAPSPAGRPAAKAAARPAAAPGRRAAAPAAARRTPPAAKAKAAAPRAAAGAGKKAPATSRAQKRR